MRPRAWLFYVALLGLPLGCTLNVTDDSSNQGVGGKSKSKGSGGSATGGTSEIAGTSSQVSGGASPCGDVTESGRCEASAVVYCSNNDVARLDCAQVGADCVTTKGRADCEVPSRAASCGTLTALGSCEGAVLKYCSTSVVAAIPAQIDCAAYGQTCSPHAASDGGAQCVPIGTCPASVTESGICSGNVLHFCDAANEYVFDCGADECRVVGGFADCFMPGSVTGCGTETAAGRCEGNVLVKCQSELVSREDCAALGLSCVSGSPSQCQATTCPSSCANGYACTNGRCVPAGSPTRQWTVLVYMVGDNNLSDAAWSDINEMEEAGSTDAVQVVVQWELSSQYTSVAPKAYQGSVYRTPIVKDADPNMVAGLASATTLGAIDMTDPARLAEFVRWGAETYPAQHTAVILWDHGFGWRGGFVDSQSAGTLSLREITTGLRDSGVHPALVAFDACLMGMHEVEMALRGVTDILVASEEVAPGGGFPYGALLSRWIATPTQTAQQLGTSIAEEYSGYFDTGLRARSVTMSVVDLTKAEASNAQLAAVSRGLLADLATNRRGIASAVGSNSLLRFREQESADLSGMLGAFSSLEGEVGPAATGYLNWLSASGLVVANRATRTVSSASGVAIYLPRAAFSAYNANSLQDYRESTSFLPLQPWHQVVASLTGTADPDKKPPTVGATGFSVQLSWGDTPTSSTSSVDLDLYIYEPGGEFGTPANGAVTANGLLSADSGESGLSQESYELRPVHASGTYLVLVNLYRASPGQVAYPKVRVVRNDAATTTFVRGKIQDRVLTLVPMNATTPLGVPIDSSNIDKVRSLDYSSIWYVTAIDVR
jgi:hypothetical protein